MTIPRACSLLAGVLALALGGRSVAAAELPPQGGPWQSEVARDHTLVGRILDTSSGAFLSEAELLARLVPAHVVLLGEKHDNPDHHRLQARLLAGLLAAGRTPAVAFEMLDADDTPAVARFLASGPADAAGLAEAVAWQAKGWPAWPMYQPIFDLPVHAKLPVVPANFPEQLARKLARGGTEAIPPELVKRLGLDAPVSPAVHDAMAKEIADSHCGYAIPGMVEPMILVQRARDEHMAQAVLAGATADGAVLVTGFGHARNDRAVPARLRAHGAVTVLSVAFLEVDPGHDTPADYAEAGAGLPWDLVWFTPRVDNEDPCEKFRAKLEKMKGMKPPTAAPDTPASPAPQQPAQPSATPAT
jgi:uncharacterized iron-regulated protein